MPVKIGDGDQLMGGGVGGMQAMAVLCCESVDGHVSTYVP